MLGGLAHDLKGDGRLLPGGGAERDAGVGHGDEVVERQERRGGGLGRAAGQDHRYLSLGAEGRASDGLGDGRRDLDSALRLVELES